MEWFGVKTIKLVGVHSNWVISMPTVVYWFFNRFARVRSNAPDPRLQGRTLDFTYFDEEGNI